MCNLETYCHKKHGNLFHLAAEIQGLPNFAVIDAFRILVDETEHAFAQEQKVMESSIYPGMQHILNNMRWFCSLCIQRIQKSCKVITP